MITIPKQPGGTIGRPLKDSPRPKMPKRKCATFRFDDETHDLIKEHAIRLGVKQNWLVEELLREHLSKVELR